MWTDSGKVITPQTPGYYLIWLFCRSVFGEGELSGQNLHQHRYVVDRIRVYALALPPLIQQVCRRRKIGLHVLQVIALVNITQRHAKPS